jgi:hypothetical protein
MLQLSGRMVVLLVPLRWCHHLWLLLLLLDTLLLALGCPEHTHSNTTSIWLWGAAYIMVQKTMCSVLQHLGINHVQGMHGLCMGLHMA